MRFWLGLRNSLAVAVVTLALLLGVGALISRGGTGLLVPTPEDTAQEFVTALQAKRIEGAFNLLSRDQQEQVGRNGLRRLVQQIEQTRQGIENAQGLDSREQGGMATAQVEIEWGTRQMQTVQIPLVKEHGIWKVAAPQVDS